MAEGEVEFAELLRRFNGLGRSDRKAILDTFSAEERLAFENAAAAEKRANAVEEARKRQADRQFLGYSQWLAEIVEGCIKGDSAGLAPAAAKAVAAEHARLAASETSMRGEGWRGLLDRAQYFLSPPPQVLP